MVEMVRVTVAPGSCVKVAPHPSGIAALGPLYLYAGASVTIPAAEVEQLYQRGDILHPATGQAMPRRAGVEGMTISVNGSRPMLASDPFSGQMLDRAARELAEAHEAAKPRKVILASDNQVLFGSEWPVPFVWREGDSWPAT